MATLYVTEYARMAIEGSGVPVVVGQEPSKTQTVSIGGASTPSNAFSTSTRFVRLHTDAICNIQFGAAPSAQAGIDMRLAAGQTEFFGVAGGMIVAVIAGT